jgi:hypothetical protein
LYIKAISSELPGVGAVLEAGKSMVRIPLRSLDFFSLPNRSGDDSASNKKKKAPGDLPGGKAQLALEAYNLIAICEPTPHNPMVLHGLLHG